MQLSRGLHSVVTILAVSVAALSFTSLSIAQVTSTTAGEIAVRSNQNAANLATNPGDDIAILFDRDVLTATDFAPSADHVLSQGKYLVLYSTRWDHSSGDQRAEINTRLTLEPVGGGAPVDLKYGRAQGYIRTASGANEAVVSGGTIVEAAATGDILRLHGTRTDENGSSAKNLIGGATSIQFLKLEDTWDCLRLSNTLDQAAAGNATFLEVIYDQVDEASLGAMNFAANTGDITFNQGGRYLVMANTSLLSTNFGSTGRTGYTQRLTLDGTPVAGSTTTNYVRGHPNNDGCHDGVLAIGTIIQAAAGQILNVQTSKEQGVNCTITSAGTGLVIVQLPSAGSYLSLSDNSSQDLNTAAPGASVKFGPPVSPTGLAFSHTSGTSAVTVNKTGTYLFLSGFFCLEDTTDRQVPWQTWKVNGTTAYGGSTRYSRNNQIDQNGNWSGFLASLTATDTVEVNSQALGAGGSVPGNDLGLQGVHIESLFPSVDPQFSFNASLNVLVGSIGTVITDETSLLASDANTGPESLIYTITSAITGGVLNLGGNPLGEGGTFTQEDVNNDLLTFDADAAEQTGGFDFSVSDGGANPDAGTFVINLGITTLLADDSGVTDEDTNLFHLEPGASFSLLDNDTGTALRVINFDATSAEGAAVTVAQDGTFSYDPVSAGALQALAVGEQGVDTFTYTVGDFQGNVSVATVSVLVNGVNDDPVAVNESITSINGSGITLNLLSNENDVDASDILTVSNVTQQIFGGGGAVTSNT
ncbi:MAG: cadherin-like domain-containing protein, partial [Verrucomicrobiota bacterium]|nr:cadherin-like domain-containing protein [Verrucomicrobiota bacterium]